MVDILNISLLNYIREKVRRWHLITPVICVYMSITNSTIQRLYLESVGVKLTYSFKFYDQKLHLWNTHYRYHAHTEFDENNLTLIYVLI